MSTAPPSQTLAAAWQQLVTQAVLGTGRAGQATVTLSGRVGELISNLDNGEPERRLLACAGVLASAMDAGRRPRRELAESPPAPCESDTWPACSPRGADLLKRVIRDYRDQLLPDWCERAAQTQRRVPESLLAGLLDAVAQTNDIALHTLVMRVAGLRGQWLAARNPRWSHYGTTWAGDPTEIWQSGTREERLRSIHELRRADPAKARELILSTWADEPPDIREPLIDVFAINLAMDDEPFLEDALNDKRKAVRTTAADLLAGLPESRLCKRMTERLTPLLKLEESPAGLLRRKRKTLVVELPGDPDKAMLRDALEAKPLAKMGPKAVLLHSIVAASPLSAFSKTWQISPAELIRLALETEWKDPLIQGWAVAAARQQDRTWALALLSDSYFRETSSERLVIDREQVVGGLTASLTPEDRERIAREWLGDFKDPFWESAFVAMLEDCRHRWSPSFTKSICDGIRHKLDRELPVYNNHTPRLGAILGLRMDPETAWTALAAFSRSDWPTWCRTFLEKLLDMLALRRDYLKELSS